MRKKILAVLAAGILTGVFGLTSCSNEVRLRPDGSPYTSFLPPETATVGEVFAVDAKNEIQVTDLEVRVHEDGRRMLIVHYDWTNGDSSATTVGEAVSLSVTQGGVSPKPTLELVTSRAKLVTTVAPGETLVDIEQGYGIQSTEPFVLSFMGEETTIFIDGKPASAYPVVIEADFPE